MPARLSDVLTTLAITTPTPIQRASLPDALAGRDVLGRGRTGSGKTLAFLLPVVARLQGAKRARSGAPRALILAPTRELAGQIGEAARPLAHAAGLTTHTVFGGVSQNPQVSALQRGVDILVACPGRLEDLIQQGHCSLAAVEITVLDEADHMADLGFLPAVRRLLSRTPKDGQRMLFSATLDRAIDALVRQFLTDPAVHEADSARSPVGAMSHHILHIDRSNRLPVLLDLTSAPGRTVVFTRTKHGAKALRRQLDRSGVAAVEMHGNLSQNARTRNLEDFHAGRATVMVATDIAARGIHVDNVTLVIHADPPADHKAYLHRSGRTARAGNAGTVVTLMTTEQASEVKALARAAGIAPKTTRVASTDDPVLAALAPGARELRAPRPTTDTESEPGTSRRSTASGTGQGKPSATRHRTSGRRRRGSPDRRSDGSGSNARRSPSERSASPATHSAAGYSARRR